MNLFNIKYSKNYSDFIIQPFINSSVGSDIRIFILNRTIFSYKRTNSNDFRSNLSQGGTPSIYRLNCFQISELNKFLKILNNDFDLTNKFVGIDIFNDGLFKIIEINSNPGFYGPSLIYKEEFNNFIYTYFSKILEKRE